VTFSKRYRKRDNRIEKFISFTKQKMKKGVAILGSVLVLLGLGGGGALAYYIWKKNHEEPDPVPPPEKKEQVFAVMQVDGDKRITIPAKDAADVATLFRCAVATRSQLADAFSRGAEWCQACWIREDNSQNLAAMLEYPTQSTTNKDGSPLQGCGDKNKINQANPAIMLAGVTLYGKKPTASNRVLGPYRVLPFSYLTEEVWDDSKA
jgi:hypothetical protein